MKLNNNYTEKEAKENGFIYDRKQILKILDIAPATLGRRLKKWKELTHYVYIPGVTKPTPMFHESLNPNLTQTEIIQPGESIEAKQIVKKSDNSGKIQKIEKPKHLTQENLFILPSKIFLTLDEASLLTGMTKTYLKQFSELYGNRRLVKKSKLENI